MLFRSCIQAPVFFGDSYSVSLQLAAPVDLQAVDGKLDGMCGALKDLGSPYCAKDLPELREEDFASVKDKDESKAV